MSFWRNILKCGVATASLLTAAEVSTQDAGPIMRVWVGEQPMPMWTDPQAERSYVGTPPRNPAETARIERAADHILRNYPFRSRPFGLQGFSGTDFRPQQDPSFEMVGVLLRSSEYWYAFGGGCGSSGDSEYLTVPAAWFDQPASTNWLEMHPELSVAMAIGWRQVRGYCEEVLGLPSIADDAIMHVTPAQLALNGLGGAFGLEGLWGSPTRDGSVWNAETLPRTMAMLGVTSFTNGEAMTSPMWLMRRMGGLRRVDQPLFAVTDSPVTDSWFWHYAGRSRQWNFLPALFASTPSADTDVALRQWFDAALREAAGDEIGLARGLPAINWNDLTATFQAPESQWGQGIFRRDVWQAAMVSVNGAPGCRPVVLSLRNAVRPVQLSLAEAASNCIVVEWEGPWADPELPPSFTVVARASGVDADGLDALHLAADQNWTQTLTVESGGAADTTELLHETPIIRPGIVVEDARSGEAVKTWEVVLRPDATFDDGRMTLVFTNLHPDDPQLTRPMNLDLTVGPGAHEARQDLTAVTVPEEGDPCSDQRPFSLGIARSYAVPAISFHIAALDAEDFSITGYLLAAEGPSLQRRLVDCARIQMAIGVQGPGVVGQAFRGPEEPNSPTSVCAGSANELASLGAQAIAGATGGNIAGMAGVERLQPRQVSFTLTARSPITGPGVYQADASADYQNIQMEERGQVLPTSNYGEGTITVEQAGPGHIRVRYEARFEPQQCSAYLAGTISGTLETVAALPLVGMSRRAFVAPRPIDLFGERLWMQLPAASRREMRNQDRRAQPEATSTPAGGGTIGGTGEIRDPTQCSLSPQ